jgi:hypothetical protein
MRLPWVAVGPQSGSYGGQASPRAARCGWPLSRVRCTDRSVVADAMIEVENTRMPSPSCRRSGDTHRANLSTDRRHRGGLFVDPAQAARLRDTDASRGSLVRSHTRVAAKAPVVWGLHDTVLDRKNTKHARLWVVRDRAALPHGRLSGMFPAPIRGSRCTRAWATRQEHWHRSPNGFDTNVLKPSVEHRRTVRAELGLAPNAIFARQAARLFCQVDHRSVLQAEGAMARHRPVSHVVMIGKCRDSDDDAVVRCIANSGVAKCFHLSPSLFCSDYAPIRSGSSLHSTWRCSRPRSASHLHSCSARHSPAPRRW